MHNADPQIMFALFPANRSGAARIALIWHPAFTKTNLAALVTDSGHRRFASTDVAGNAEESHGLPPTFPCIFCRHNHLSRYVLPCVRGRATALCTNLYGIIRNHTDLSDIVRNRLRYKRLGCRLSAADYNPPRRNRQ